ncbi:hypothetical protein V3H18_01935 [Methylocystis sp. 9N]|uniref:Uncharacterized protein n=1 Tax=Methylocystis borbori TaxID=3118750 RepID=A0ABU7XE20_9HYPH
MSDHLTGAKMNRLAEGAIRQRASDPTPLHVRSDEERELILTVGELGQHCGSNQRFGIPSPDGTIARPDRR